MRQAVRPDDRWTLDEALFVGVEFLADGAGWIAVLLVFFLLAVVAQ